MVGSRSPDLRCYLLLMSLGKTKRRAKHSFVSYHLERLQRERRETDEELEDIKGAAGAIYAAGSDTVSTRTHLPLASDQG